MWESRSCEFLGLYVTSVWAAFFHPLGKIFVDLHRAKGV